MAKFNRFPASPFKCSCADVWQLHGSSPADLGGKGGGNTKGSSVHRPEYTNRDTSRIRMKMPVRRQVFRQCRVSASVLACRMIRKTTRWAPCMCLPVKIPANFGRNSVLQCSLLNHSIRVITEQTA